MKIGHKIADGVLYVGLCGELDEHSAGYTRDFLDALFENAALTRVVIDMSKLAFMDSTGIGVLLGRFKKLRARKIPIMLANPSKTADKILKLSGIYELMPKVDY